MAKSLCVRSEEISMWKVKSEKQQKDKHDSWIYNSRAMCQFLTHLHTSFYTLLPLNQMANKNLNINMGNQLNVSLPDQPEGEYKAMCPKTNCITAYQPLSQWGWSKEKVSGEHCLQEKRWSFLFSSKPCFLPACFVKCPHWLRAWNRLLRYLKNYLFYKLCNAIKICLYNNKRE